MTEPIKVELELKPNHLFITSGIDPNKMISDAIFRFKRYGEPAVIHYHVYKSQCNAACYRLEKTDE